MAGGGSKRDDGVSVVSSTNIFAALESRKKKPSKKRSDKERQDLKDSALPVSSGIAQPATQTWAPTPVSVTSWADCEEDDDDFFAMPALPPLPSLDHEWHDQGAPEMEEEEDEEVDDEVDLSHGEESEGYDEVEEGNEENKEPQMFKPGADLNISGATRMVAREPEKQLSKKELKKKGLAELEAALAELGLNQNLEKDSAKIAATKEADDNDGVDSQPAKGPTLAESKSSKRRKAKKEKSFKEEGKEEETPEDDGVVVKVAPAIEANEAPVDKSELLKKLSSMKKKKSSKDGDLAAKAAAAEAAVRAVKLAAAKKKEKNHYNQQPVR